MAYVHHFTSSLVGTDSGFGVMRLECIVLAWIIRSALPKSDQKLLLTNDEAGK